MSFKKTYIAPFSRKTASLSSDVLYWKRLSDPILLKEVNLIESINISPIEPHFIAVTCSSRVQLYHPITRMIHKNYNRFKQEAYGGVFRRDGRLLLTGSEEAALKLFDVSSKNLLRVFKGHTRAVHRCHFLPTDNQIVSFSDDRIIGHWDMPSETLIHRFEGHTDYIRSGAVIDSNPNLIFSGSYDHTVRVWDKREQKELFSLDHGSPVETILPSPTGSLLFTAGGTEIRVWDCLSGGRLLSKISHHHKTITCLSFASNSKRLVSASLDRHVKIYDMANFEVIHSMDYSSPILSLGIAPSDKTVAVGMSDGIIAISRMQDDKKGDGEDQQKDSEVVTQRRQKSKRFSDFVVTDFGISEDTSTKDPRYDNYLRNFRYSMALDSVLSDVYNTKFPATTVAVFQELIRRSGLTTALAGRTGKPLIRVLRFLIRHIRRPRYMRVLIHVAHVLVDLYATKIGEDKAVDDLFLSLVDQVTNEVAYMADLMEVKGSLEMILVGAELGEMTPSPLTDITSNASNKLEPSENAKHTVVVSLRPLQELIEACRTRFFSEYETESKITVSAPGRVNIIGEHTDYNDGFVLPMAIPLWTVIVGRLNGTDKIRVTTLSSDVDGPNSVQFLIPTEKSRLVPGHPNWANYVKGVLEHFPVALPGFDACIITSVPLGGGLSSSASLEVATCMFLEVLTQHSLPGNDRALLCQKAEHTFPKMPCGIMDQLICCLGKKDSAILIDCKSLQTKFVPIKSEEVGFLVINSNVKHELSGSEYPQRRADCFEAAKILQVNSLRYATLCGLRNNREKMGDRIYQRALHVVTEIERCQKAADCLKDEDFEGLGRLMYQSHVSLRDLYEVSCPELNELVDITMQTKGVLGSRMTGGGFGGCIVVLIKKSEVQNVQNEVNRRYKKNATCYVFDAVSGAEVLEIKA